MTAHSAEPWFSSTSLTSDTASITLRFPCLRDGTEGGRQAELDANAQLARAAPRLLAELRACRAMLLNLYRLTDMNAVGVVMAPRVAAQLDLADDAIRMATGPEGA